MTHQPGRDEDRVRVVEVSRLTAHPAQLRRAAATRSRVVESVLRRADADRGRAGRS